MGPNQAVAVGPTQAVVPTVRSRGDDAPIVGTEIQIDKYRTPPESILHQDVVIWYGGPFGHALPGPHVSHIVGPELRPVNW